MKDPAKAKALVEDARKLVTDVGFTEPELAQMLTGQASVSLRDSRLQQIIRKAILYDRAQKAVARPAPRNLPPVQRPGSGSVRQDQGNLEIRALKPKQARQGKARDFARLLVARRQAQSRGR